MKLQKPYRAIVLINLLVVFIQFVFAGQMLGGSDSAVTTHGATGVLLVLIAVVQTTVSVFMRIQGVCPRWLVPANIGILLADVVEAVCGHFHVVAVHVPLAVAIFGGIMRQLFWSVIEARTPKELRI
jgi:hypothetical protein